MGAALEEEAADGADEEDAAADKDAAAAPLGRE